MGREGFWMGIELELLEGMDPCFNWRRSVKGRRTARRCRISFTGIAAMLKSMTASQDIEGKVPKTTGRKKSMAKRRRQTDVVDERFFRITRGSRKKSRTTPFKLIEDLTDKQLRRPRGMPFSESEKFGVSVLRRHFSDSQEFASTKNIHSVSSSLPPTRLTFDLDGFYNQTESGQDFFMADTHVSMKNIRESPTEVPDFSGISLLASAACSISMTDGTVNAAGSEPRIPSFEGDGISRNNESCSSSDIMKESIFTSSGCLDVRTSTASSLNNVQSMMSGVEFSSHCKFSWDLNAPAELFEDPLPETVSAEPLVTETTAEHGIYDDIAHQQPYNGRVGLSDSKHVCSLVGDQAPEDFKVLEKPLLTCQSTFLGLGEEKCSLLKSNLDSSAQEDGELDRVPVLRMDIHAEIELTTLDRGIFGLATVKTESQPQDLILTEDLGTHRTTNDYLPLPEMAPTADFDVCGGISLLAKYETQAEKYASLQPGLKSEPAMLSHLAEDASDALLARTSACRFPTSADGVSGDSSRIDAIASSGLNFDDSSKREMSSCLDDSHPFTCIGSSHQDELSSGSTSAAGHVPSMDVKMKSKCSVVAAENVNSSQFDGSLYIVSNSSTYELADALPRISVAPPSALSSHGTCKSYVDNFANSSAEVVKGVHSGCGYNSPASQTGTDQVIALDKLELLSDDDSQYEEGEFRGSIDIQEGEGEDNETECVDYGSDNTKIDVKATGQCIDSVDCKYSAKSETGNVNCVVPGMARDAAFQPFMRRSLIKDAWITGCGNRSSRQLIEDGTAVEESWSVGCRSSGGGTMAFIVDPFTKKQRTAMFDASNVSESLRSAVGTPSRKYLPSGTERPRFSDASHRRDRHYAKACRSGNDGERDSKFRDVINVRSTRTEKPSQSRPMHNKVQGDYRVASHNHWDLESPDSPGFHGPCNFTHSGSRNAATAVAAKLESNGFVISADGTIVKVGGARRLSHANDSSERTSHSIRRRSPIDRDDSYVIQQGLANWKGRSPPRCRNTSRGRTDGCDPVLVNTGRREYHAPERNHERLYRRDRNFSPHMEPLHLSRPCTSSISRSRTSSPMWRHPSGSNDRRRDISPIMRQRSRSPHFKPDVREEKVKSQMHVQTRSPHQRSSSKSMGNYAPSARNYTGPLHVSRRPEERNASPNQSRERKYRESPGRRICRTGFSQDHKFHRMESRE